MIKIQYLTYPQFSVPGGHIKTRNCPKKNFFEPFLLSFKTFFDQTAHLFKLFFLPFFLRVILFTGTATNYWSAQVQ